MSSSSNRVQGFIAPGHVCTVVGCKDYEDLVRDFRIPIVVGGFEPVDILEAVLMLVRQLEAGETKLENQYVRSVSYQGNLPAQQVMAEVFEVADQNGAVWPDSTERLASAGRIRRYDAEPVSIWSNSRADEPAECISAEVLQGLKKPTDCPAFECVVRQRTHRERPWFLRKGHAPPTITTGAMRLQPRRGMTTKTIAEFTCPAPLSSKDTVLLGHGSGGKLSAALIRDVFLPVFEIRC